MLDEKPGYKVKELVINPNSSLSMQRHFKRSEHWYVLKGTCNIITDGPSRTTRKTNGSPIVPVIPIGKETWHKGVNP